MTATNIQRVQSWLTNINAGGGTQLLPALKQAIALPKKQGISRTMAVITDGYVRVEKETFALIKKNLGTANLFVYGIGTGVNRHLIESMARSGRGDAFVVTSETDASA